MKRRDFLGVLGGAAAWPVSARGQQSGRVRRIGILAGLAENDPEMKARLGAFRDGLEMLGWFQGSNVLIEARYATAGNRASAFAKEIVALKPDVLFANSTPMAAALQNETREIPIVFVSVSDPIGSGFVASLARPNSNLTGLMLYEEGIAGKWLAMLKEIAPTVTRAALLANPRTTPYEYFLRSAVAKAQALAVEIVDARVGNAADIERTIESFARLPGGGLVLPSDVTITGNRDLIIQLAAKHRLPAVYSLRTFVIAGGLMCYGTNRLEDFKKSAFYVDRILKGAKPADLPVEAPSKYETIINLKTAKALGLEVPPGLLVAADEVIE